MALSEMEVYGPPDTGGGPEDRVPPQDVAAEQSALGSMMLSKDAIAECSELVKAQDFYRPAHETIFEACVDLYSRGEPVDAITVGDELTKRGDLQRIGGTAYLHQLIGAVPTAANASFYAEIVAERAVLRRLVEAGTRIVQSGYTGGDVEDIVNAAQAEVYAVADKRGGDDYHPLGSLLEPTMDEIEHAAGATGDMTGVPTGFTDLDELTNGFHPGQMIIVAARPAVGKALALDTPLPTPTGWTTMGEVAVGDEVLGADGRPTRVVAATEVMLDRPCFEVEFSDGSVIVADEEHLWQTSTRAERRGLRDVASDTRTTGEIAQSLRCTTADQRLNHSVALSSALDLPDADLPLSPYVLGAWLGDGESAGARLTTADEQMPMLLEAEGVEVRSLGNMLFSLCLPKNGIVMRECVVCGVSFQPRLAHVKTCGQSCGGRSRGLGAVSVSSCPDCGQPSAGGMRCRACFHDHGSVKGVLRKIGVLGNKHIPHSYLRASQQQRRAVLAGLLDTDGTVTSRGCPQFTTTSERLAEDVYDLVVGLGYRCGRSRKSVAGRSEASSVAHTLTFSSDEDVFRLERKKLLHKELRTRTFQRRNSRFISEIRAVRSVPVRCIQVSNPDHLYLAGRSMIPTHNSTFALDVARSAAIKAGMPTVVFSLEMSRTEITMRLLSAESEIPLQNMRKGTMRDRDWTRLAETQGRITDAPLFIDDSPNMSLMEIRAKCRRLKQRHNLKLVIVDYLQLMSSGKRVESRQQEVAEFSRALKLLAKELEVPLIALSQLNRGPEQRTDKKPQMSDLRESGCLTADTRVLRADTGAEVTMGELYETGAKDVPVWSLDESLRYVRRHLTHVFPTGTRPVFRLTLKSGKTVTATENHPFLTYDGWKQLGDLRTGDRLAVPRHVPAPELHEPWDSDDAILDLAARLVGGEARMPAEAFHMSKRQIALLIAELWRMNGHVRYDVADESVDLALTGAGPVLDQVAVQLLRFGVSSVRDGDALAIVEQDDQRRFLREIAPHTDLGPDVAPALVTARRGDGEDGPRPVLAEPAPLWQELGRVMEVQVEGGNLSSVVDVLDREELDLAAINDVLFEELVCVELDGVEPVFDATVLGGHNFVANGIAVHNSIEQDADVVILLHRESLYERESPREGEADVIVAKHRNGPTDTAVVAFQGHYSKFTNMASNF